MILASQYRRGHLSPDGDRHSCYRAMRVRDTQRPIGETELSANNVESGSIGLAPAAGAERNLFEGVGVLRTISSSTKKTTPQALACGVVF